MATSNAVALAGTIFQGRSTDKLVVKDGYSIDSGSPINSVYESAKGIFGDTVKSLYANKGSIRELAQLAMDAKAGAVNKQEMLTRALGAMGSSLPNLLSSIGGTLASKLSSTAGMLIGDNAQKAVAVLYNNAETILKVANIDDGESLIKFVGELAGDSELAQFINIEAEAAIIAGMAKELLSFGIPDLVDTVMEQSRSDSVKIQSYTYLSTEAMNTYNYQFIDRSIDVIGVTKFLEQNPGAVDVISNGFYFGLDDTVDKYPALRVQLLALLVKIDPNWDKKLRNGVYITDLGPYAMASKDAKTLFRLAEPERTYSLAAEGRQKESITTVVKNLYPNAYIPT